MRCCSVCFVIFRVGEKMTSGKSNGGFWLENCHALVDDIISRPEQERRLRAVLDRGAYKSVRRLSSCLTALNNAPCQVFAGTPEELDTLLAEGLASKQLTEDEFLEFRKQRTDALLASKRAAPVREGSVSTDRQAPTSFVSPHYLLYCRSTRDRPSLPGCCQATISPLGQNPHVGSRYSSAIREFTIFDHGGKLDLKRFGFITLWRQTPCTLFVSLHGKRDVRRILEMNELLSAPAERGGPTDPNPRCTFCDVQRFANSRFHALLFGSIGYAR